MAWGRRPTLARRTAGRALACAAALGLSAGLHSVAVVPPASAAAAPGTIALSAVAVAEGVPAPDSMRAAFEDLLAQELTAAGFSVIASAATESLWTAQVEAVGECYDAFTGERDSTRFAAAEAGTRRRLLERFGARSWLTPSLEVTTLEWEHGNAKWDGVSQDMGCGGGCSGTVGVLSLAVEVRDPEGTLVHRGRGGIRALATRGFSGWNEAKPEKLLGDDKRNRKAVRLALGPLVGASKGDR